MDSGLCPCAARHRSVSRSRLCTKAAQKSEGNKKCQIEICGMEENPNGWE